MITLVATIIAIVGCLNWILVGLFGFNFIAWAFGASFFATLLYIVIGLAGAWLTYYLIKTRLIEKQKQNSLKKSA